MELVFVVDKVATSLVVAYTNPEGLPKIEPSASFKAHHYKEWWFEFTSLSPLEELRVKQQMEKMVNSKLYRMNTIKMIMCSLPSYFKLLSVPIIHLYFEKFVSYKLHYNDVPDSIQTYCAEMIGLLLNEAFPTIPKLRTDCNSSELVLQLLKAGRIKALGSEGPELIGMNKEESDLERGLKEDLKVISSEPIQRSTDMKLNNFF